MVAKGAGSGAVSLPTRKRYVPIQNSQIARIKVQQGHRATGEILHANRVENHVIGRGCRGAGEDELIVGGILHTPGTGARGQGVLTEVNLDLIQAVAAVGIVVRQGAAGAEHRLRHNAHHLSA
jgi:hypothetical protein